MPHPLLILDGGMGRELLRRGAPFAQPQWSALALMQQPSAVADVHRAYIDAGADIITTTLAGYTEHRAKTHGPDLELVKDIRQALGSDVFLTAEGRYHTPEWAAEALTLGADAVIIGTAITDVSFVTAQFVTAVTAAATTEDKQ